MSPAATPAKPGIVAETTAPLCIDGIVHQVVEIKATGDVILDVTFENTLACTKSIPSDAIQKLRISRAPISSSRFLYRVRLETLKKVSKYFTHLLGSDVFGEGRTIEDAFKKLASSNLKPSEIEAERLPRIMIVDEDDATRTMGREHVFRDMLRIVHGLEYLTKPITMTYLSVLVIMADRFDCLAPVQRYVTGTFSNFKYPLTLDKSAEETLRQKILIFYYTNQAPRLAAASKELILRGSSRWGGYDGSSSFTTAWWDLVDGLESMYPLLNPHPTPLISTAELSHRRACILRTLSSIQTHFLTLYTSRNRQCTLGYDSSPACDSFQLGEMIKFLTKKNLLSLIPFQAASPYDPEYIWPEAYTGDIENIIATLRQCPSYQIDKNHGHCGLRSRILPMLDYVGGMVEGGVGMRVMRWKTDRGGQSWASVKKVNMVGHEAQSRNERRPFVVGGEAVGEDDKGKTFDFMKDRGSMEFGGSSMNVDKAAKALFTAENWVWTTEREDDGMRLPKTSPSLKF